MDEQKEQTKAALAEDYIEIIEGFEVHIDKMHRETLSSHMYLIEDLMVEIDSSIGQVLTGHLSDVIRSLSKMGELCKLNKVEIKYGKSH